MNLLILHLNVQMLLMFQILHLLRSVDVLRNLFNRFKRLDNENVQQTFDRLTDISNELQALGANDITDHKVVKKLLRSLDSSFDTLAL